MVNVDADPAFDPTTIVVDDDGTNTVLDFGFGTIQLDGVTGGGTPFASIQDINDAAGYDAVVIT